MSAPGIRRRPRWASAASLLVAASSACGGAEGAGWPEEPSQGDPLTVADRLYEISGLESPEAVRYDPDQDVWFVASFGPETGAGDGRDGNGFVSRVDAETGTMEELRFAVGSDSAPLHQPRGMFILGDTLWVVDTDGVHGFDRRTGEQRAFVDFTALQPGFLNDIAADANGVLYVTDSGRSAVYRIVNRTAEAVLEGGDLGAPNGIHYTPALAAFVLVPWEAGRAVLAWSPGSEPSTLFEPTPGLLDGVESLDGDLIASSQSDSTIRLLANGLARTLIITPSGPADIGLDVAGRRIAVPYIEENRVDVWRLP